ncbi:MAG TPA: hypothetical protein VH720_09035, partial [Candidatus Limnocylindrales bacterium]
MFAAGERVGISGGPFVGSVFAAGGRRPADRLRVRSGRTRAAGACPTLRFVRSGRTPGRNPAAHLTTA